MTAPDQDEALQKLLQALRGGSSTSPAGAAVPPSLPPVNEDPMYLGAETLQRSYLTRAAEIRGNFDITDLAKAQQIAKLWVDTCAQLVEFGEDIQARRTARAEWIERQLPVGPGIPADVSPADRVVLNAAWRTAWERVTAGDHKRRQQLLAEATRFGDDTLKRAVLTACLDLSETDTVDEWTKSHDPATGALLTEWRYLRSLIAGDHFDNRWEPLTFRKPPKPGEVNELPRLERAREAAQRGAGR
ncbi:hypothetical protein [Micromonospora sp. NPDC005413]|uniref:hypothetical protein n=1 Tax=Micromonospora sp. NPDC005413 TaxID=3154563 RepID=UPI00339E11FD